MSELFSMDEVPVQRGLRWHVKRGTTINYLRGFRSKAEASAWVDSFGHRLDWRAGFLFMLRGDTVAMQIIDKYGTPAKP